MTISSSLNAGVTGLSVNATRLATISDNIANSSTYGYKRATADFHSLVIDQSRGTYSAGGVRVTTGRNVAERGTLITTNNPTDLSIAGRGFLPVTGRSGLESQNGELPLRMTTTGSFRADANGYLVTESRQVLLGWPAQQDGSISEPPRDTVGSLRPVRVDTNQYEGDATTNINLGVNLPAEATKPEVVGDGPVEPIEMTLEYYGNLGEAQNLTFRYIPTRPPTTATEASNEWTVEVFDSAQGGAMIGNFKVHFDSSRDHGGTIATDDPATAAPNDGIVASANTGPGAGPIGTWDSSTGKLTVQAQSGPITIDIGRPEEARGLSQLSDTFAPVSISKNGSPVGNLASIEVDANGMMSAVYDTGFTRTIYQIPVVDVPNANGLKALPNQTYAVSGESGAFYLWDAADGPVGDIVGFSREESATDVAGELTALIQTQRAYASNAKVIQTVDEMLQETTNIKR